MFRFSRWTSSTLSPPHPSRFSEPRRLHRTDSGTLSHLSNWRTEIQSCKRTVSDPPPSPTSQLHLWETLNRKNGYGSSDVGYLHQHMLHTSTMAFLRAPSTLCSNLSNRPLRYQPVAKDSEEKKWLGRRWGKVRWNLPCERWILRKLSEKELIKVHC